MMNRTLSLIAVTAGVAILAACDTRQDPLIGRTPVPALEAPTGNYDLRAVDGEPLPHDAVNSGVVYSLVAGTFLLSADSNWHFSTVEVLAGTNGQPIGSSPANYEGRWSATDTTIVLKTSSGTIKVKGDTLFWRGGPKHTWEDTLTFTLVKK
jgi:hypothetical protein